MTNNQTIPMPSARLAAGRYEVIGTSSACEVRKTNTGWALYSNGSLLSDFPTKRAALAYCQEHPEL